MKATQHFPSYSAIICVLSLLLGVSRHHPATAEDAISPALIEAGHYQAILGDCAACHSASNRPAYSGGVPFTLPIGTLYASNISPDPIHGIGTYSEADFSRAVRQGVRKDGSPLYPAMPYPSYARMSDADIHALYIYFHNHVAPQAISPPANTIKWPLSIRWPLHIWRWLFSPSIKAAQKRTQSEFKDPILSRGAYLVEGAGHCGACHTPRSITLNEKAQTAADGPLFLSGGGVLEGWVVPSLRQENRTGLGRWSEENIVEFLQTGRTPAGVGFGGMTPVITHSSHAFSESDLHAIARYLLTLAPAQKETLWVYDPSTAQKLRKGDLSQTGARLYVDRCAACHRTDGTGYGAVFPPLAGNPVVMTSDPTSLVHIILKGGSSKSLPTAPSAFTMPAFEDTFNDRELADLVSFIRHSWGNKADPVSDKTIHTLRHAINMQETPVDPPPKN